jgi:predicted metal-dependent phosphoesterase TrpH
MKICDLHTHSIYSDGTLTPRELAELAKEAGVSAIALTDHNSVGGLCEFIENTERLGIIGVAGVEFSTEYRGVELHILGLFIDREHFAAVEEFVGRFKERKAQSNIILVENLSRAGYIVDLDGIKAKTPDGYVNRAHIAAELVKNGYVESVNEAFSKLLSEKNGFYQPPLRNGAMETIEFIRSIGGVSVLAHPFLQLDEQQLREFLGEAVGVGLDGMETEYSLYSRERIELSEQICDDFGILKSGGSDFHGANKPDRRIAVGNGNILVPFDYYEKLAERHMDTHERTETK